MTNEEALKILQDLHGCIKTPSGYTAHEKALKHAIRVLQAAIAAERKFTNTDGFRS